jgi:hypothetical protein
MYSSSLSIRKVKWSAISFGPLKSSIAINELDGSFRLKFDKYDKAIKLAGYSKKQESINCQCIYSKFK